MAQTTEKAFETYVEEILLTRGGWKPCSTAEWDKERALFPEQVFAFIADTQPKLWAEMQALHAAGLEALLLTSLVKELDAKGSLHVLRHGFKFYGKTFRLAYFKPAHGANYEVLELFGKNRLRYMKAFERYITANKITDVRPLVAFSGTVKDPDTGVEYTEPGMNTDYVSGKPISEKQLPERFNSLDYQVLLVANKYQTGFDQPLLCAMYVDKRLDGVQAVQTLSRLNRKIPGKENPFVLDFVNESEDIYKAFKPYYDATSLQEGSDPQQLEQLKHELDASQVYFWSEVEAFARIFYKPVARQSAQDHAGMQLHLQPAVDRFKAMADEQKRSEFREKLKGYLQARGDVVIVEGLRDSVTSVERVRGFYAALAKFPAMRVVANLRGDYQRDVTLRAGAAWMKTAPRFDAILAANDVMALGMLEVLEAAGRDSAVVGINAVPDAIAAIKRGKLLATVDFDAMKMGCIATEAAIRHLRGERVPPEIMLPVQIVDRANCTLWDKPFAQRACPRWEDVTG